MFYPIESLRRGGKFYLCWVADSWPLRFATITHRQLWSQDVREICNDLLEVMKNESGRPTNRFSLRLSSQLMRGLVRLYQRKVTVFVGDLCMINAHVMKSTHKKWIDETSETKVTKRQELPRLVFELQPDEEAVEEKIQNSGNMVARIEDITLKEPTLPENRLLLDDGFGELNPDQPIQMLAERSVEMMLFQDPVQHSALDLPLDYSTDKSHDKSRLKQHEAQMERLSEHDISGFGKSTRELLVADFEKEIPDIPELPLPDPPHTDKELGKDVHEQEISLSNKNAKLLETDEIVLEELEEEPQTKRRKIRNKLIIDKKIQLSSNYMRSRISNICVELRCENGFQDVASVYPPGRALLAEPARPLGRTLRALHARAGGLRPHAQMATEAVLRSDRSYKMRTLSRIDEEPTPGVDNSAENPELQGVSERMDVICALEKSPPEIFLQEPSDIADVSTQKLPETSQAEKRVSEVQRSPKKRRSGYVSFRRTQQAHEVSTAEANKEYPGEAPEAHIETLLQRAGLRDSRDGHDGRTTGSRDDTPQGSLDRTKVSLGDSENTTDSKKFIREEWGTQGTMHKIYKCIKSGMRPLEIDQLISSGPHISGHKRVIVAKCFTSILKLKQHGFIRVRKDSETYEIKDITLGRTIIRE